jgi:hypothetical protein
MEVLEYYRFYYHLLSLHSQEEVMDMTLMTKVIIPAPPPGNVGSRLLVAGAIGALTGNLSVGAAVAGRRNLMLNEKIKIPLVCNLCGANQGLKYKAITKEVVISELADALGGSIFARTTVELRVPVCDRCVNLPTSPGVSLESYMKVGAEWRITLLFANSTVAELCAEKNQEILQPGLTSAVRLELPHVLSPDNKRMVYGAKIGGKWTIVVDGAEGKAYDRIAKNSIAFSPNSQRVVYGAKIGGKWAIVVDGAEGKAYDDLTALIIFSPDSQRMVYGAKLGDKWTIVLNGVEGKAYDGIMENSIAFSPDSQRMVYGAKIGAKWTIVVDGAEGKPYAGIRKDSITFSPDSKKITYEAKTRNRWTLVVDGVEKRR